MECSPSSSCDLSFPSDRFTLALHGCDEIGRRRAFERQSVPNVSHEALLQRNACAWCGASLHGNMPSLSPVFSQRIEGRHCTCTFPPAPPAASPQPCHSVSDSREWPIDRRVIPGRVIIGTAAEGCVYMKLVAHWCFCVPYV